MANQVGVGRVGRSGAGSLIARHRSSTAANCSPLNCTLLLSTVLWSRAIGSPIWEQVGRPGDNLGLPGNSSSSFLYRVSSCLVLARISWTKTAAVCLQSDRIACGWNQGKPFNRGVCLAILLYCYLWQRRFFSQSGMPDQREILQNGGK